MKVKDKDIGQYVDVCHEECPERECYWPRTDPGAFVKGRGYRSRGGEENWLCGNRQIHGCPDKYC